MKVFWAEVTTSAVEGGHEIRLDGRPVRTPGRSPMILPKAEFADFVANEWRAQAGSVNPLSMPGTRLANSAIEKVKPDPEAVVEHLTEYAASDLLCYRADGPRALIERQNAAWGPLLDWASEEFGARLATTTGVMPIEQPTETLVRLRSQLDPLDHFQLAGIYELITLSGSFVIGLAALKRFRSSEALWEISRLDESWQIEQWGVDEGDAAVTLRKQEAFLTAAKIINLLVY